MAAAIATTDVVEANSAPQQGAINFRLLLMGETGKGILFRVCHSYINNS